MLGGGILWLTYECWICGRCTIRHGVAYLQPISAIRLFFFHNGTRKAVMRKALSMLLLESLMIF